MKARWIFILITLIGLTSCEDINRRSPVPYVPVSYTLNITSEYPHFVVDNGYQTMTITQRRYEYDNIGYAGLLVWIAMDGQYHAADAHNEKANTAATNNRFFISNLKALLISSHAMLLKAPNPLKKHLPEISS
jgi:hypothetical protein